MSMVVNFAQYAVDSIILHRLFSEAILIVIHVVAQCLVLDFSDYVFPMMRQA